ncbi:uncharacterized protein METZ01_LOCUS459819, partial [marine metagenome]
FGLLWRLSVRGFGDAPPASVIRHGEPGGRPRGSTGGV